MLRGNVITGAVSVVILSSVDVFNIFQGRISGAQLFKNIANTASAVAGGTAGWVVGATIGSVVPVVGTLIGGLIGSFAGGSFANQASNAVLSELIEDDANEMIKIIENTFVNMAEDYLLTRKEAEEIVDLLKEELSGKKLKDMFESSDRKKFAQAFLIDHVEDKAKNRQKVSMPVRKEMVRGLKKVLEDITNSMNEEAVIG